ncbi:MAG: hypothetical protein JNN28_17180 [Saprospiraceae bacterium]|nr:hypothetical protein [Saprospiraceae bacterium]
MAKKEQFLARQENPQHALKVFLGHPAEFCRILLEKKGGLVGEILHI